MKRGITRWSAGNASSVEMIFRLRKWGAPPIFFPQMGSFPRIWLFLSFYRAPPMGELFLCLPIGVSLLREYIRTLLAEAAMTPQDLEDNMWITVSIKSTFIQVILTQSDKESGHVSISLWPEMCDGAWQVSTSNVSHGWGPLLYDVAMELATIHGSKGLTTDRTEVSGDAFNVWHHYLYSRNDVEAIEIDMGEDTMEGSEDCPMPDIPEHDGSWEHPSWFRYKKSPTTIAALKKLGKYQER